MRLIAFEKSATDPLVGLGGVSESVWDNLIYGPPPFAPLLFVNPAILAAIGLWEIVASEI